MKILVYSSDSLVIEDLLEKRDLTINNAVLVSNHFQAISALKENIFEEAILNIASISDLKLIKYINRNNKNIKVLLFGDSFLNEIIPIIKNSSCEIM